MSTALLDDPLTGYLSVKQIARMSGCTTQYVYKELHRSLKNYAMWHDGFSVWLVNRAAGEEFARLVRENKKD